VARLAAQQSQSITSSPSNESAQGTNCDVVIRCDRQGDLRDEG